MTGLPIERHYERDPARPITDEQRDELTAKLSDAYTKGEISIETYQIGLDSLYDARSQGELVPVIRALPERLQADLPAVVDDAPKVRPGYVDEPSTTPAIRETAGAMRPFTMVAMSIIGLALIAVVVLFLL